MKRGRAGRGTWAESSQCDPALRSFRPSGPRTWTHPVACPYMRRVGQWNRAGVWRGQAWAPRHQAGAEAGLKKSLVCSECLEPGGQPGQRDGRRDKQSPQGGDPDHLEAEAETDGIYLWPEKLGGQVEMDKMGSLTARLTPGTVWVPLLGLVALDRPSSGSSDSNCRGPRRRPKTRPEPLWPGRGRDTARLRHDWPSPLSD